MIRIVPDIQGLTDDEIVLVNAYWWLSRAKYENVSVFKKWLDVDHALGILERSMGKEAWQRIDIALVDLRRRTFGRTPHG